MADILDANQKPADDTAPAGTTPVPTPPPVEPPIPDVPMSDLLRPGADAPKEAPLEESKDEQKNVPAFVVEPPKETPTVDLIAVEPLVVAPVSTSPEIIEKPASSAGAPDVSSLPQMAPISVNPPEEPVPTPMEPVGAANTDSLVVPPASPPPPPPPNKGKPGSMKKSVSKGPVIAVLLLLLLTIPVAVYFISQKTSLTDLRNRAALSCPGGYVCSGCPGQQAFCNGTVDQPATQTCAQVRGTCPASPPGGGGGGNTDPCADVCSAASAAVCDSCRRNNTAPKCTQPANGCKAGYLCVGSGADAHCEQAQGNGKPTPCTAAMLAECKGAEVKEPGGKECINKKQCVYTNIECNYAGGTKWCFKRVESDCSGTCGGGGDKTPTPTKKPSSTPTSTPTGTPGNTPTNTPTGTPGNTSTPTPTGGVTNTPTPTTPQIVYAACNQACTVNMDCGGGLVCLDNVCRNATCSESASCSCAAPTPKVPVAGAGPSVLGATTIAFGFLILLLGLAL